MIHSEGNETISDLVKVKVGLDAEKAVPTVIRRRRKNTLQLHSTPLDLTLLVHAQLSGFFAPPHFPPTPARKRERMRS